MKNLLKRVIGGVKRMAKTIGATIKDACGLLVSKDKIYERRTIAVLFISAGIGIYASTYVK